MKTSKQKNILKKNVIAHFRLKDTKGLKFATLISRSDKATGKYKNKWNIKLGGNSRFKG